MFKLRTIAAATLALGLAACGDNATEQALYGAGTGMLGSLIVDGDPVVGAIAGGAANVAYCQTYPNKCN